MPCITDQNSVTTIYYSFTYIGRKDRKESQESYIQTVIKTKGIKKLHGHEESINIRMTKANVYCKSLDNNRNKGKDGRELLRIQPEHGVKQYCGKDG